MSTQAQKRAEKIVRYVRANPDATAPEIHEATDIPLSTVHKYLAVLTKSGELTQKRLTQSTRAIISVGINLKELVKADEEFPYNDVQSFLIYLQDHVFEKRGAKFHGTVRIEDAFSVLGGHSADVMILAWATEPERVYTFVTEVIRSLRGVAQTDTALTFGGRPRISGGV